MVFLFGMSSNTNVNAEVNTASQCVRQARSSVQALADEFGWDIGSGGAQSDFAVGVFMILYTNCLGN